MVQTLQRIMIMDTIIISGKPYEVDEEVADLIISISRERDLLRAQRIMEEGKDKTKH
jgi:hypothetical protein